MVKKLNLLLLFVLTLSLLSFIDAAPPFEGILTFDSGYVISLSPQENIKQGEHYTLNFFLYNKSTGFVVDNSTTKCIFYLANSSGDVVFFGNITYDTSLKYWDLFIKGTNFSSTGMYPYGVQCQGTAIGGSSIDHFMVSYSGQTITTSQSILYSILLFGIVLFFILILYFIGKLPDEDRDEDGNLLSISKLKYLRSVLVFIEWMFVVAILFLTSNLAYAYLTEQMFAKILFMLYQVCFIMTLPIVVIWFIWIFVQIFQDNKMKRLISKGIYKTKGGGF